MVPEEAEVVKKIYELYLSGNGVSRITSFLNKKGFVNVAVPGSEESTSGDAERSGNVPEDASAIHIWMIS